jgi:hypothetical protein
MTYYRLPDVSADDFVLIVAGLLLLGRSLTRDHAACERLKAELLKLAEPESPPLTSADKGTARSKEPLRLERHV